jgi:lipopolysaccharide export LptBFGC system permease protein LptF
VVGWGRFLFFLYIFASFMKLKKVLQRAVTVVLMLGFGISAFVYLFFDAAQFRVKEQARTEMSAGEHLETIKLSLNEFSQYRDNDEIWVNGRLYDISSYKVVNDQVFISVFHDNNEEGLVKVLSEQFDNSGAYATGNSEHVSKHITHAFDDGKILANSFSLDVIFVMDAVHPPAPHEGNLAQQACSVIKPPPDNLS